MMVSQAETLSAALTAMGLAVAPARQAQLLDYLRLLEKWNRTYNLTAIHEPAKMLTHHLLDSVAVLPYVAGDSLLDVGSGGGLPGIPLAVLRDDLEVTLIDASQKKCAFLQQAAIQLGLGNVEVVHGRVEAYRHAGGFSQIVSRAFSDLDRFVQCTEHLLAAGGEWFAMKGLYPEDELSRLSGARLKRDIVLHVPGLGAERHLLVLERI